MVAFQQFFPSLNMRTYLHIQSMPTQLVKQCPLHWVCKISSCCPKGIQQSGNGISGFSFWGPLLGLFLLWPKHMLHTKVCLSVRCLKAIKTRLDSVNQKLLYIGWKLTEVGPHQQSTTVEQNRNQDYRIRWQFIVIRSIKEHFHQPKLYLHKYLETVS